MRLRKMREIAAAGGALAAMTMAAVLLLGSAAQAGPDDGALGASRAGAKLAAGQADSLQAKADRYLAVLGKAATRSAPDKITLPGATLVLAVPGAERLAVSCPYTYFCAYSEEAFTGDAFLLENCSRTTSIPWVTTGSWRNNQTPGTQPWLYFFDDPAWHMPGAYAEQAAGVDWSPVRAIDPC
jgi:hypothetical protein